MLTPDQLAALRAAAEAATPGPHFVYIDGQTEIAPNGPATKALLAHIDAQAARIAELERDAARYYLVRDWLVAQQKGFVHYIGVAVSEVLATDMPTDQMLDAVSAAIDAAMEAANES
ncbi:hypothetical protein BUE93_21315 [Chromobacterium amazonense]|uniref:Uncharacterized protein n=1 Tax=Chromobacterium amazonense TaxID=1382803 RepID=A0A2S9WYU1_9NEIS|nr:hypothetical protein [Chromobacterium amazonense]PRP68631.1 hypothetical protein BUE93_21315 [Chromobacterium amazonense]